MKRCVGGFSGVVHVFDMFILSICPRQAMVKVIDMADDFKWEVIDLAALALEKFMIEKEMASWIKKQLDDKTRSVW